MSIKNSFLALLLTIFAKTTTYLISALLLALIFLIFLIIGTLNSPLLLFSILVVGFSVLFTSTIHKSESICSDKDRLFTNEDSYTTKSRRSSEYLINHNFNKNTFNSKYNDKSESEKKSYPLEINDKKYFEQFRFISQNEYVDDVIREDIHALQTNIEQFESSYLITTFRKNYNDDQKTEFVSETINDVRKTRFDFANIDVDLSFSSIEASNKKTNDKNENNPDFDRIREIQQGIDIAKEKLKEYIDFKILFNEMHDEVANLEDKLRGPTGINGIHPVYYKSEKSSLITKNINTKKSELNDICKKDSLVPNRMIIVLFIKRKAKTLAFQSFEYQSLRTKMNVTACLLVREINKCQLFIEQSDTMNFMEFISFNKNDSPMNSKKTIDYRNIPSTTISTRKIGPINYSIHNGLLQINSVVSEYNQFYKISNRMISDLFAKALSFQPYYQFYNSSSVIENIYSHLTIEYKSLRTKMNDTSSLLQVREIKSDIEEQVQSLVYQTVSEINNTEESELVIELNDSKNDSLVSNYVVVNADYEDYIFYKKVKYPINEFLENQQKEIESLTEDTRSLKDYLSNEHKYILEKIRTLRNDIEILEN
ncbi:13953_t:CDS:2 [Gigaspora rosea]|nr:13953_t:CDS:2 [Gigaspora rosea]